MLKKIPFYEISGNHQSIGEFLGTTFKKNIQESIKQRRATIPNYEKYLSLVQSYINQTQEYLPNLIVESQAIAKAAEIPFTEFFFQNTRELYDGEDIVSTLDNNITTEPVEHCTSIVGFNKNQPIVGHNEDWAIEAIDELYILKATIENITFISLNYATVIPGISASMNNYGLVQCINDVYQISQVGVPKNYIARAILETTSLDEAENLIKKLNKASGFSHLLIQNNRIRNIEILKNKVRTTNISTQPYVHTNHYLDKDLSDIEPYKSASSEARYVRAANMLKSEMSKEDILNILMDTYNKEYPICRPVETIGSVVFLPNELQAHFCYGNPKSENFVKYSLEK